jgi:hypothetical protein
MSRAERTELASVVKMRARVAKAAVAQREAELLADVEEQLSARYKSTHEAWKDVTEQAEKAVKAADQEIARICREIGVPENFRPELNLQWWSRGENAEAGRRAELRALAKARIDAMGKSAKTTIEARSAEVLTELVAGGLESAEAKAFLESIPTPAQLMPAVVVEELTADRKRQHLQGNRRQLEDLMFQRGVGVGDTPTT